MSKRAEEAAFNYACEHGTLDLNYNKIYDGVKYGYEQAEKDILDDAKQVVASFEQAFKQAEKDLGWHSVEESLPPMDEEVIVLRDEINDCLLPDASFVGVAHIVNTDLAVDYNGWNVPGVRYWMPMPKLPKEEER